jgi:predicted amidohydrolase
MNQAIASETRAGWAEAADPGELFLHLWCLAGNWTPADRAILPQPLFAVRHALSAAVASPVGRNAVNHVLKIIEENWPPGSKHLDRIEGAGLVIQVMHAIDDAFAPLHPRTRVAPPVLGAGISIAGWLDAAERRRHRYGSYAERDGSRLVPNGPFARHGRGRDASSANSLQDHFPYLTAAPMATREQDRIITIHVKVIGTDAMRGVPAAGSIGRERVRFIPLAEEKDDLAFETRRQAGRVMLDVQPTVDMASRLLEALNCGSDVDIAFAPELTFPGEADVALAQGMAVLGHLAPRIVLAGSGLSVEKWECGRAWNEARVFGRGGTLLWRQRKIWPFEMQREKALKCGLPDPGKDECLVEDVAGHSTVTVVDIDGFGRCVVLICQDIEARPVVEEIVARYQPDWILTPVLDPGVKVPGWAHQRAVALSKLSQARIMVGSSLTMSCNGSADAPEAEPAIGLAVGPADPTIGPDGVIVPSRALALVKAAAGPSPRIGLLVWDYTAPTWGRSSVDAA